MTRDTADPDNLPRDQANLSTSLLKTPEFWIGTVGDYHSLKNRGDLYDSRYRLSDKLGYGGYSTIWLARDLQSARYVAVKAITADAKSCTLEDNPTAFRGHDNVHRAWNVKFNY